MKNIIAVIAILCSFSPAVHAQGELYKRPISKHDSMRLDAFFDSVNHSPVFSLRRQHFLDSVLSITPWNAGMWQQKAMPVLKQKKYDLGIGYLDSAVKYDTKIHKYLEYRAFMKCIFQRSYRESIKDFDQLLALQDNRIVMDHSYYFYKGLCYLQLNEPDSCIHYITLTINQRRKANVPSLHYLDWYYAGIAHYEKEDYSSAIAMFDSSISLYKQFSDGLYYKTLCYNHLKQPELARQTATEAITNFKLGYTINEDNALHEDYPYQIKSAYIDGLVKYFDAREKESK